ncbi:hypothetical protein B5M09_013039 [Aphanomyces astaci]|uniref:Inward rectifier potassium channel C-terminal domain-containing protein n=1 Tax=Aphanomyces astaci TaxID=112090 RepID=A0A425CQ69_APHAT|nr:hypothetical protein B5M09_013039 [Aphanomyces astaci]
MGDSAWRNVWHGIAVAPASRAIFPGSSSQTSSAQQPFFNMRSGVRPRALYKDLAYFLINLSWPRLPLALAISYFGVIFLFALAFYFVCQECNDLFDGYNLSYQAFSTIGFGIVYSRDRCGNYVTILESYMSMVLLPTFAGIIFSKFSLPKVQVAFSNVCCIQPNYSGNHAALVVRVANASSSSHLNLDVIMDASFSMELFSVHGTLLRRHKLPLKQADFIFFRLALELVHVIDAASPLYATPFSPDCMLLVTFTGVDSNRHATIVNQVSYTHDCIAHGAKFVAMLSHEVNHVEMDFDRLSDVALSETSVLWNAMGHRRLLSPDQGIHHEGMTWEYAASTSTESPSQPFVEPTMAGLLLKHSSARYDSKLAIILF